MKYNIPFLIVLFFLIPFLSNAQPPGYLGQRASLNLSLSNFIAFWGPTQNNRGKNAFEEAAGKRGFNYEWEASFDYVVRRYRSLAIIGGQYYTGAISTATTEPLFMDASGNGQFNDEMDHHDLFLRLNVRSVGITYSKFKRAKGALAPIGNRVYFGLKRNFVKSEIIDKKTAYHFGSGILFGHQDLELKQKVAFNYLLIGWSNNQVFWNKVIFKTGLRFALPLDFGAIGEASSDYDKFDVFNSDNPNQDNYDSNVFRRLMWHEAIRFDIGLGYLLF